MSAKQDVVLTQVGQTYDISIADNGDLETEDSFDSAIITSIFTEARANKDQVVTPERRRGWMGSQGDDFILGNTAWVYGQFRNRQVELNEIANVIQLGLQHFVEDRIATDVSVSIRPKGTSVILTIIIKRPNNKTDYRYYELWNNTGAK